MKRCSGCLQLLDLESFAFKSRERGVRQAVCRACASLRARSYYRRGPSAYKARAAASKPLVLKSTRRTLREYLSTHPCADCHTTDVTVLEFDHRDSKRNAVSDLVRRGASWALIAAEILKCDVVCANCHRRRTARQFGWFKVHRRAADLPPLPSPDSLEYEPIKNYRNRLRRRYANRSRLLAYLGEHSCAECGVADPIVLDFDHRRDKTGSIAEFVNDRGWSVVLAEIRKCVVLCANCHRKKTASQAGRDR